jgi:hypothetical protein
MTIAEIFLYLYVMASSIRGCLHLKQLQCLVWSLKLNFQIWGRPLVAEIFHFLYLSLSSVEDRLPLDSSSFKMSVMFGLVT